MYEAASTLDRGDVLLSVAMKTRVADGAHGKDESLGKRLPVTGLTSVMS
jgi:hypothetical protein